MQEGETEGEKGTKEEWTLEEVVFVTVMVIVVDAERHSLGHFKSTCKSYCCWLWLSTFAAMVQSYLADTVFSIEVQSQQ